jgi:hypothetical protein
MQSIPPDSTTSVKMQPEQKDMGAALRTVYQKAVEEAVPDEMLDLLGKLN